MSPMTTPAPAKPRAALPAPALWASAFVLAALVVVQLGRSGGPSNRALADLPVNLPADTVSRVGDYTVLTFNAGSDDILAVLDGRGEELFFYRVKGLTQFEFLGRDKLADLFATAKRLGPGRK